MRGGGENKQHNKAEGGDRGRERGSVYYLIHTEDYSTMAPTIMTVNSG